MKNLILTRSVAYKFVKSVLFNKVYNVPIVEIVGPLVDSVVDKRRYHVIKEGPRTTAGTYLFIQFTRLHPTKRSKIPSDSEWNKELCRTHRHFRSFSRRNQC